MKTKILLTAYISLLLTTVSFAQRPPAPQGQPDVARPPRDARQPAPGPNRPDGPPQMNWIRPHDTDQNGKLDGREFQAAVEQTFAALDKNGNGMIDAGELSGGPRRPPTGGIQTDRKSAPGPGGNKLLPPFFFSEATAGDQAYSRSEFEKIVRSVFDEIDLDKNGEISTEEMNRMPRPAGPPKAFGPPPPPNAQFIGAELRFGDKLVKGQPFSAETLIEDTRLLFDGTTVKMERRGAIYRDGSGRTRREQPFEMVGGVSLVGSDGEPQKLVFINDFENKTQYFLDQKNRVARKNRLGDNPPPSEFEQRSGTKNEIDGVKVIEGVSCTMTRTEFEIPAGQIGNDKALKVRSERCFSEELQMLIMSINHDPIAGIHLFKLVNIKRNEPSADLFKVPAGYRIENQAVRDF
ncbi:MAG: EF-hand domain-containing protein [Pyrinomonadaceae bacterium]